MHPGGRAGTHPHPTAKAALPSRLVKPAGNDYLHGMTLKVLIHTAEEGGFWAEVPALPGCVSQGETVEEVRSNVREAIEGWLLAGHVAV